MSRLPNCGSAEFERLKKELRSIALSVGPMVYVSLDQLDRDYADLNGHSIRYYDFGFNSLHDLVASMTDAVVLMDYGADGVAVIPISDRKTQHLEHLIAEQKPAEPTRFGGVVPGLDNKENNRRQMAGRGRGRTETRRPANEDLLTSRNKRPVSTIGLTTVFRDEAPPVQAPIQKKTESRQPSCSPQREIIRNFHDHPLLQPPGVVGQGKNQSNKISYSRYDLIEIRHTAKQPSPKVEEKSTTPNDTKLNDLNSNEYVVGDDYSELDLNLLPFVVRNIVEIVKHYSDGLDFPSLKMLYAENYANDPPIELIEKFGPSIEEFFEANCANDLECKKSPTTGVFTLRYHRTIPSSADETMNDSTTIANAASSSLLNAVSEKLALAKLALTTPMTETANPTLNLNYSSKSNDSQSSLLDAPVGALDKTATLTTTTTATNDSSFPIPIQQQLKINIVPTPPVVENLILLDDDPAVLAFERHPTSPRPTSSDQSILISPVFSRKVTSSNNNTSFEKLCRQEPVQCRGAAAAASIGGAGEWPEEAPFLDPYKLGEKTKIPRRLWQEIYSILREYPNGIEHAQLMIRYSQRYQKSLGGQDFFDKCGVKNLKDLFAEIYNVDVFENSSGNASYRLRRVAGQRSSRDRGLNVRDKEEKIKKISKSTLGCSNKSSTTDDVDDELAGMNFDDEYYDEFEEDADLKLPPQPAYLLPPKGRLTDDIRYRVYRLLRNKFPHGIDVVSFNIAYSKFYKGSINAQAECKMTFSEIFLCMRDIIEIGTDDMGRQWLKAKPLEMLKHITQAFQCPAAPNLLDLSQLPRRPPAHLPIEIAEKFRLILEPCQNRQGLPYRNFETLLSQPSMTAFFTLFGFRSFSETCQLAVGDELIEIFNGLKGEQRVRLKCNSNRCGW